MNFSLDRHSPLSVMTLQEENKILKEEVRQLRIALANNLLIITGERVPREMTMKEWLHIEAKKHRVTITTIQKRLYRNKEKYYPNIQIRRVNQRVIFVSK